MKEIVLTQGKVAMVDEEDYEWLNQWKWCVSSDGGYPMRREYHNGKGKAIFMHRL